MRFIRSEVDTCMYFRWNTLRLLVVSILWIGGDICFRRKDEVKKIKRKIKIMFDCDDVGGLKLYGGCNVDNDLVIFKFTQPLILQSFEDELYFPKGKSTDTPGETGFTLRRVASEDTPVSKDSLKYFRSGVVKILHMMSWPRTDIYKSVRDLSINMSNSLYIHTKTMQSVMKYCVATPNQGWNLEPKHKWYRKHKFFGFVISGKNDSDLASCKDTRRSVTEYIVCLKETPISVKSTMQNIETISITAAETKSGLLCAK